MVSKTSPSFRFVDAVLQWYSIVRWSFTSEKLIAPHTTRYPGLPETKLNGGCYASAENLFPGQRLICLICVIYKPRFKHLLRIAGGKQKMMRRYSTCTHVFASHSTSLSNLLEVAQIHVNDHRKMTLARS